MTSSTEKKPKLITPPPQPADLIREWAPWLRRFEPSAEIDFSWSRDAITICDMRTPNALRYRDLYTTAELVNGDHKRVGDVDRRVRSFMEGK